MTPRAWLVCTFWNLLQPPALAQCHIFLCCLRGAACPEPAAPALDPQTGRAGGQNLGPVLWAGGHSLVSVIFCSFLPSSLAAPSPAKPCRLSHAQMLHSWLRSQASTSGSFTVGSLHSQGLAPVLKGGPRTETQRHSLSFAGLGRLSFQRVIFPQVLQFTHLAS